jgi:fluoride exporter
MIYVWLALAGGLGGVARVSIEDASLRLFPSERHWATFLVNVLGCAGVGILLRYGTGLSVAHQDLLTVGFLGGFTTFSSALAQPAILWRDRRRVEAFALVVATPLIGALALLAARRLG